MEKNIYINKSVNVWVLVAIRGAEGAKRGRW